MSFPFVFPENCTNDLWGFVLVYALYENGTHYARGDKKTLVESYKKYRGYLCVTGFRNELAYDGSWRSWKAGNSQVGND